MTRTATTDPTLCSCGRPATRWYDTERFGRVGSCGMSDVPVIGDVCTDPACPRRLNDHAAAWCAPLHR